MLSNMQTFRLPAPSVCRAPRTSVVVRANTNVASPINPNIQKDNPKVVDTVPTSTVEKQVRKTKSSTSTLT